MSERHDAMAYLRAVVHSSPDAIVAIDTHGNPLLWNDKYLDVWGVTNSVIAQSDRRDRLAFMSAQALDPEAFFERIQDVIDRPDERLTLELILASGAVLVGHSSPVTNKDGERVGQVVTFRDVTEHRSSEDHRRFLSLHDSVTGFLTRAALHDHVDHLTLNPGVLSERRKSGIVTINVPCFATFVRNGGFRFGDRLLAMVADRFDTVLESEMKVARYGEAEFLIHAPHISETDLRCFTTELLRKLAHPFVIDGEEHIVTAYAGISMSPRDGKNFDDLVQKATIARQQAETNNEPVVIFSEQHGRELAERTAFETDLNGALERDEFFLVYQPFFDLKTGEVSACEALLRWNRNGDDLVPPMDFIPYAEHTGLIVDIGEWVLREVCRQTKQWQDKFDRPISVSVNVSARQLAEPDFDEVIEQVLTETDLPASLLQLELTETMRISDATHTADMIDRIIKMGVRVSLDDYGTGFTNLSYLKKFKFMTLKVDRSFTQGIGESVNSTLLMEAAIATAKKIGLTLVAEGVETEEQLRFLRATGADQAQGFLLAPPTSAEEVTKFFNECSDLIVNA